MFAASRKRQQSNDGGVPRLKQPHIEDGKEIVQYTWGVHGEEWAVAGNLSHLCANSVYAAVA